MKILIEAHHPAHIHFWKYPIRELQELGHEVLLIGRDRDVMNQLLEAYDWITAIVPRRRSTKNRFPLLEMVQRQWLVMKTIARFKPDVVASLMGSYTQSAKLFGIRNIIFTDTETQGFNHRIAHPFADEIYTPACFLKDLGPKQVRYKGLHELVYLHPDTFVPDPSVLDKYKNLSHGRYVVIRLSAWNTFHDRNRSGIGEKIYQFVDAIKDDLEIVLSAEEGKVPPGLEKYCKDLDPEDFHSLLAHARFVLTEGASTASEAACLGVPAVFINSVGDLGNFALLDDHNSLLRCFRDSELGVPCAVSWIESFRDVVDQEYLQRYRKFLEAHRDGTDYISRLITM